MDTLMQDLRFAARMLVKSPAFTLIAVLCTALGIGANTTIFSVVNALLLRPFPYSDPERIVALHGTQIRNDIDEGGVSYLDYRDLQESGALAQVAAYTGRSLTFSGNTDGSEEPERVQGMAISASLFPLLGAQPMLGRNFREDEDRLGAPRVVLLSHELWQRRFDSDPHIVGKSVMVNAMAHMVVGVMQPGFKFPDRQVAWIPVTPLLQTETDDRGDRDLAVLARLKPDTTLEQAQAEMAAFAQRLAKAYPDTNAGWGMSVRSLREEFADEEIRLIVLTMMGAVVCVLLIACANVANLLLARATGRQREMSVRIALGAGRMRILRQLLTESVLVALLGGALGILFGYWGIHWMEASFPADNQPPYWIVFSIDRAVLLYTLGISVVTGILFGLAPALQAAKTDINETLKEGARGASSASNRLRNSLVMAEVALSLVLLVGASLFMRSFLKLQLADGGFETANLLTLRVFLPGDRYDEDAPKIQRVEDLVRRIEALPGVEGAMVSNFIPLGNGGGDGPILLEDRAFTPGEEPQIFYAATTPHMLRTIGLSLVAGRDLTDRESLEKSAVGLVNRTFAKKFWPDQAEERVLGRRFRLKDDAPGAVPSWITIVGIVPDIKNNGVDDKEVAPSAYLPYPYMTARNNGITIRTRQDPAEIAAAVRKEIRASDPNVPVFDVYTMEYVRERSFWQYRFFGGMFGTFGIIALFLAAIGVYGVLSYSVSQRWREIGIRVALGARRQDILRLVVGHGLSLAAGGIGIGILGAAAVTRVVSSILFDVSPTDPVSFGGVSLLLAGVAMYASYLPASRAVAGDPLAALRTE